MLSFHAKWNFSPFARSQILLIREIISHDIGYDADLGMFKVILAYLDVSFQNSAAA